MRIPGRKNSGDGSRDVEMSDEMRFHVEMEAEELERLGVQRDEAQRRPLA